MGELKQISEEQAKLVERVKSLTQQVYLANLGLVAKIETEGKKQIDKLLEAGAKVRGEAPTTKPLLAAFGLIEVLKEEALKLKDEALKLAEEAQKLSTESVKTQVNELKAQITSLKLKEESLKLKEEGLKLFDELVAAGEKRKAA